MSRYNPDLHHRRSIRLRNYDYTQNGGYFVTICTYGRACLFGEVIDGEMQVNVNGRLVGEEWARTSTIRPEVMLDAFVVMPNHIHGVVVIANTVGATRRVAPTNRPNGPIPGSIGAMIGQFKSITAKRINASRGTPGVSVWQRDYYEHVIRNETDLQRIREYIENNPARWADDPENVGQINRTC